MRVSLSVAAICGIAGIDAALAFATAPSAFLSTGVSKQTPASARAPARAGGWDAGTLDVRSPTRGLGARRRRSAVSVLTASTLPTGWFEYTDESTGNPYYYNPDTGVTTWEKPSDGEGAGSSAEAAAFPSPSPSESSGVSQRMSVTDDYMDIDVCSKFMTESFWEKGTTVSRAAGEMLDAKVRSALQQEQLRDLQDRYGKLTGERKLKSALVVLRDDSGDIEACCGVEIAVADTDVFELLPRAEGESLLKGGLASLGGRARNELRGQPIQVVAGRVLPEGYALIPVLSNLAVRQSSRGKGLAKEVCQRVEVISGSWGFRELMLLVEEGNAPACKLYESLGYTRVWTRQVSAVRPAIDDAGALVSEKVPTLCMVKAV